MKHLLVCCDLSEDTMGALESARAYAKAALADSPEKPRITLLFVVDTPAAYVAPVGMGPGWIDLEPMVKEVEKRGKERLNQLANEFFAGFPVNIEVRRSVQAIYEEILSYADSQGVDLIVMSKHGKSGMQRLLLGSVTTKIVQLAHCPVLIVPVKKSAPKTPA